MTYLVGVFRRGTKKPLINAKVAEMNGDIILTSANTDSTGFAIITPTVDNFIPKVLVSDMFVSDIDIVVFPLGGGALFTYDVLVCKEWATIVAAGRGTEGQAFTGLDGFVFRIYSTWQGMYTYVQGKGSQTVFISPGTYTENVTYTQNSADRLWVTGGGWRRTSLVGKTTLDTLAGEGVFWEDIRFSVSSPTLNYVFDQTVLTNQATLQWDRCWIDGKFGIRLIGAHFDYCEFESGLICDVGTGTLGTLSTVSYDHCYFGDDTDVAVNILVDVSQSRFVNCQSNRGWKFSGNWDGQIVGCIFGTSGITDTWLWFGAGGGGGQTVGGTIIGNKFSGGPDVNGTIRFQIISGCNGLTIIGNKFTISAVATTNWAHIVSDDVDMDTVAIVGNAFAESGIGNYMEDVGGFSVRGNFSRSIFGPNAPGNKAKYSITGSNNEFYPANSAVGSSVGTADAPYDAQYLVLAANALLANERILTPGIGTTGTDSGAGAAYTLTSYLAALQTAVAKTISIGVITLTANEHHYTIDTEGAAATDDLDTINSLTANRIYIFRPANDARTVVFKHNTGNIKCVGNADITCDDIQDFVIVISPDGTTAYALQGGAAAGGSGYSTVLDEVTSLTARTKLAFLGAGVKAQDNAGSTQTEVIIPAYYDATVDTNDTNAKGKGNVYDTLQLAIDAGHTSIFVRAMGDVAARSRLTADIDSVTGTIPVAELANFPTAAYVLIDQEIIQYTGKSAGSGAGNLTGGTRGSKGTTAVAHTQSSGTATAGSATTLTDSGKAWAVNGFTRKKLVITAGTGAGQTREIISNTATVATVNVAWTTNPDNTSVYRIDNPVGTAIGIASTDSVQTILGEEALSPALKVHLYSKKNDLLIQSLYITTQDSDVTKIYVDALRNVIFGCAFSLLGSVQFGGGSDGSTMIACRIVAATDIPTRIDQAADSITITSNYYISNSGANCIQYDNTVAGTAILNLGLIGNRFIGNACTGFIIDCLNNAGLGNGVGWQFNGNLFRLFDKGAIRIKATSPNISGNLFDGSAALAGGTGSAQIGINNLGGTSFFAGVISGNTFANMDVSIKTIAGLTVTAGTLIADNVFTESTGGAPITYILPGYNNLLANNVMRNVIVDLTNSSGGTSFIGGLSLASGYNNGTPLFVRSLVQLAGAPAGATAFSDLGALSGRSYVGKQLGFTAVNGNNDNIAVGETADVRITGPTAGFNIRSIAGGEDGRLLYLYNATAQVMTLNHEDAAVTAANRITTASAANVVAKMAILKYSTTDSRWHLFSPLA